MARGISQTIIDELAAIEMFPFYALDFTDGTTDYKYNNSDVPITLKDVKFDNDPNIITDTWEKDAKEFSDFHFIRSSRTADATTAPDGTLSAIKITEDNTVSATHYFHDEGALSSDTVYTASIFLKKGNRTAARLRLSEATPFNGSLDIDVDLENGVLGTPADSGDATISDATIRAYSDDWYLVTITGNLGTVAAGTARFWVFIENPFETMYYNGDGSSYIYAWGGKITESSSYQYSSGDGTYLSRGFDFESINYTLSNVMDDCTLRIDNLDQVLTAIFVGGEVEEKTASVYVGVMNVSGGVIGIVQMFTGEVDSFELDETEVRLVIGSIFTRWGHQSYSKHPSSCRYKVFKGTRCTYSGAETLCDRSYTRCLALGNTANFGGYRWLSSIENKKFQWGPNQTESEYIARH